MPSIEENQKLWNDDYRWTQQGEEWSSAWGNSEAQWYGTILPRIHAFIPTGTILEIAPGFGRWTHYLKTHCERLIVVDLSETCIKACRERFLTDTHITYHVNDGKSLEAIADQSIDFVFSFDSLVHADPEVLEAYLSQIAKKLKPQGVGFIHHSNLGEYQQAFTAIASIPDELKQQVVNKTFLEPVHWRSAGMTAKLFQDFCRDSGLQCIAQELVNWSNNELPIDCFSLFTLQNSTWSRPNKIVENTGFVREVSQIKLLAGLYTIADFHREPRFETLDEACQVIGMYVKREEWESAISLCQNLLTRNSELPEIRRLAAVAHWQLGDRYARQGATTEALHHKLVALDLHPNLVNVETHNQLGVSLAEQGKFTEAIVALQRSVSLDPNYIGAYYNLGLVYAEVKCFSDASHSFRQVLNLDPFHTNAYLNLAIVLRRQELWQEVHECYFQAIASQPINPIFFYAYAWFLLEQQQYEEATDCFLQAIAIEPGEPENIINFATHLTQQDELIYALKVYESAVEYFPSDSRIYCNLGNILMQLKMFNLAMQALETAVAIEPGNPIASCSLGSLLLAENQIARAISCLECVNVEHPDFHLAYWNLQAIFNQQRNYKRRREVVDGYVQNCRETSRTMSAISYIAAYLDSGLNSAFLRKMLSETEAYVFAHLEQLDFMEIETLYSIHLFGMMHLRDDVEKNTKLCRAVGKLYGDKIVKPKSRLEGLSPQPSSCVLEKPLRIGVISKCFRRHSVSWCCTDVIVELSRLTPHIFLYVTAAMKSDDRTEILMNKAEKFYFPQQDGQEAKILEEILRDRLDVIIDLDSVTVPENIEILFCRPAPICISWMGFDAPFISSDNFLLCDEHTRPEGVEAYYVEQLLRMPDSLVAVAGFDCEPTSRDARRQALDIPPEATAYLSVAPGSKFSAELAEVHIHILSQVPNSVLIYKLLGDVEVIQSTYRHLCEARGVDFQRLRSVGMETPEEKHRTIYLAADVLLDSYPMNGGTYTLEALWFELPVVTLVGQQYCSRMGYSFLKTLEIEVGLANHWEEYISWAVRLGLDRKLRLSVRDRLHAAKQPETLSPLWNPAKFARDLYGMLEKLLKQELNQNNPENPEDPENNGTR